MSRHGPDAGRRFQEGSPVTVVIPSYRDFPLVRAAVRSLRATTDPRQVHVIVCDDASGPHHVSQLRTIPDIEIRVGEVNRGFAANVNRGLAAADPQHDVALLNSDVVCRPGWLTRLQRTAHRAPQGALVGPRLLYPDGRLQFAGTIRDPEISARFLHRYQGFSADFAVANQPGPILALSGACIYATRSAIDAIGVLDETYTWCYEDVDWSLRAWQAGLRVLYEPTSTLVHLGSQARGPGEHARELYSQRIFWERWGPVLDDRPTGPRDRLEIVYVVQAELDAGRSKQVDVLRERGHSVRLFTLEPAGAPQTSPGVPVRTFCDRAALEVALAGLDAVKIAADAASAEIVWTASVLRGVPVLLLDDGAEFERLVRHEFLHVTENPHTSDRLRDLGLRGVLLGDQPVERQAVVLEAALLELTRAQPLRLDPDLQRALERLGEYEVAYAEIQRSLSWRITAPLRAGRTRLRRFSARVRSSRL